MSHLQTLSEAITLLQTRFAETRHRPDPDRNQLFVLQRIITLKVCVCMCVLSDFVVKCIGEEAKYEGIRLLFDGLQQPLLNKQVNSFNQET